MKSLIFILSLIVILGIIIFIILPESLSKQNFSLDKITPALIPTSTTASTTKHTPPLSPSGEGFKPEGFKGPTGPPSVIGPPGPPPNY
ncbi:MAG: hypothetical protein HYT13_00915 [Candidatus Liptonbacteria bacterium]|nr:hypothetical protein [Candidatus Liptonbacteria bacterium]